MKQPEFYLYRTTVSEIEKAQAKVEEAGDEVVSPHFVAGRDWVLLCRRADDRASAQVDLAELLEEALSPVVEALQVIANKLTSIDYPAPFEGVSR